MRSSHGATGLGRIGLRFRVSTSGSCASWSSTAFNTLPADEQSAHAGAPQHQASIRCDEARQQPFRGIPPVTSNGAYAGHRPRRPAYSGKNPAYPTEARRTIIPRRRHWHSLPPKVTYNDEQDPQGELYRVGPLRQPPQGVPGGGTRRDYRFPYAKADPGPSSGGSLASVCVDEELAGEAFTYRAGVGQEGTVHIEQVLDYNRDPRYLRRPPRVQAHPGCPQAGGDKPFSERELIRRLGTSAASFTGCSTRRTTPSRSTSR